MGVSTPGIWRRREVVSDTPITDLKHTLFYLIVMMFLYYYAYFTDENTEASTDDAPLPKVTQ